MKKICLLFLTILTLLLTSCRQDTTQLAKDEFSKYYNGENEVVLKNSDNLYFENHILKEESFSNKINDSILFYENSIYFLAKKGDYINICSCDYYGGNLEVNITLEFTGCRNFFVDTFKDIFYIQYKNDGIYYMDKYTLSTGIYEKITSGKSFNFYDYFPSKEESIKEESIYDIDVIEKKSNYEHGKFFITNRELGIVKVIDDNYLKNTIYIESMEKFNYIPKRFDISNGHILLTYRIYAGDGWNYSHLVFEYDFDANTLEYKLLAFPYEFDFVDIIYVG